MWFVIVMALGGVANHVLNPSAGRNMGYLAIAIQFGFAFAFPVSVWSLGRNEGQRAVCWRLSSYRWHSSATSAPSHVC